MSIETQTKEELALDLIDGNYTNSMFSNIYPFCNENISGYMNFLDFKDKSVLTVGSSADQPINVILRGCTDLTILDVCPFAEDYFYLKSYAVQTLEPENFDKLLFYKDYPRTFVYNREPFDLKKYPVLLDKLKKEQPKVHDFWLKLISTKGGVMIRRNLFSGDEEKPSTTKGLNDYLKSTDAYYRTRQLLKGVTPTFITADITKYLPNRKFDTIILSNLTTYLNYDQTKELFAQLVEHLNQGGKIMLGYLYDADEYTTYHEGWADIYDIKRIKSIHPDIQVKSFQGVKGVLFETETKKDAVYVYQKKK